MKFGSFVDALVLILFEGFLLSPEAPLQVSGSVVIGIDPVFLVFPISFLFFSFNPKHIIFSEWVGMQNTPVHGSTQLFSTEAVPAAALGRIHETAVSSSL